MRLQSEVQQVCKEVLPLRFQHPNDNFDRLVLVLEKRLLEQLAREDTFARTIQETQDRLPKPLPGLAQTSKSSVQLYTLEQQKQWCRTSRTQVVLEPKYLRNPYITT